MKPKLKTRRHAPMLTITVVGLVIIAGILITAVGLSDTQSNIMFTFVCAGIAALFMKTVSESPLKPNLLTDSGEWRAGQLKKWAGTATVTVLANVFITGGYVTQKINDHTTHVVDVNVPMWILVFVIMAPLAEELLMRRVLYAQWRKDYSIGVSMIVTSLVFMLLHANVMQFSYVFTVSLLLCLMYELMGDIRVPIALHMLQNAIAAWIAITDSGLPHMAGPVVLAMNVGTYIVLWKLFKNVKHNRYHADLRKKHGANDLLNV